MDEIIFWNRKIVAGFDSPFDVHRVGWGPNGTHSERTLSIGIGTFGLQALHRMPEKSPLISYRQEITF